MKKKVAIVTGASKGIGSAIATSLAMDGMAVVVNYLKSEQQADDLVDHINTFSQSIKVRANIANPKDVKLLVDKTIRTYGRVDVLVNNAGSIPRPGDWQNISYEDWDKTLGINLLGTFQCIRQCAPILLGQKGGKIINIASTYAILGAAPVIAYTAAKAGVINLTRSFAKEFAPFITVNAVAPGNIDTDMTRAAGSKFIESVISETPLKRLGTPEDVANLVSFLASPKADFITGQVIVVDGGHMMR